MPPLCNQRIKLEFLRESSILLYSGVNSQSAKQALLGFTTDGGSRIGVLAGENSWKWRVANYQTSRNSLLFDDFVHKLVDYLVTTREKRQLVSHVSKLNSDEQEQVRITANVYNELYQPIKSTHVSCLIESKDGIKRTTDLLYNGSAYSIHTSGLISGNYDYTVTTTVNGKKLQSKGFFTIKAQHIEEQYLPANYDDMNQLTSKFGGVIYMLNQYTSLVDEIGNHTSKSKLIKETQRNSAIDSILILGLILVLLSAEWLIRKYFGLN
jgi:hypothetical protein